MQGTRPGKIPRRSATAEGGRVCEEPGCGTTLSIYNSRTRCWQHSEIVFPNFRGKRLRKRTV